MNKKKYLFLLLIGIALGIAISVAMKLFLETKKAPPKAKPPITQQLIKKRARIIIDNYSEIKSIDAIHKNLKNVPGIYSYQIVPLEEVVLVKYDARTIAPSDIVTRLKNGNIDAKLPNKKGLKVLDYHIQFQ